MDKRLVYQYFQLASMFSTIFDQVLGYLKFICINFAVATIINAVDNSKRGVWDDLMTPLGR